MGKGPRKQLAATRSNTLPPRLVKKTSENKQAVPSEMKAVTKIVAPSRDITNARSKFIRKFFSNLVILGKLLNLFLCKISMETQVWLQG